MTQPPPRIDRRTFVRRVGALGALSLSPAWLAACGSDSGGGSGSGGGDPIKIGWVSPRTGPLADFAAADDYILRGLQETFSKGIRTKAGTRPVKVIAKDSQSSSDTAGQVASDLILQEGIDLMVVGNTPENANPVSDQCELNGVPCISTTAPWQSWFFGRKGDPAKPFKFTYHFFWGLEDLTQVYTDLWAQVDTNKRVGALWPNDSDGNAFSDAKTGFPPALQKGGYQLTDPGRYEDLTNDYSAQISRFKAAGDDIITGVPLPPDFGKIYKQAAQQGFRPKVATVAKAILFPSAVEALGSLGEGLSSEIWWSPQHPFKSSITETSAKQLADGYSAATKKQWTQPTGFAHALFEVAVDVLGRASDPKDKEAVAQAISETQLDTICGRVSWADGPVKNVAKTPLVGGQWVKGQQYPYDLVICTNELATDIPKAADLKAIGA